MENAENFCGFCVCGFASDCKCGKSVEDGERDCEVEHEFHEAVQSESEESPSGHGEDGEVEKYEDNWCDCEDCRDFAYGFSFESNNSCNSREEEENYFSYGENYSKDDGWYDFMKDSVNIPDGEVTCNVGKDGEEIDERYVSLMQDEVFECHSLSP